MRSGLPLDDGCELEADMLAMVSRVIAGRVDHD